MNPYLRTRVLTAGPEELRLLLFEGAIKFCRQAKNALTQSDFEGMYTGLLKAQKIAMELSNSLKRDIDPALCDKLTALYGYVYRRLVDASMDRDETAIDECIRLLEFERETWQMLMAKIRKQREAEAKESATPTEPLATIGPADDDTHPKLSVQG